MILSKCSVPVSSVSHILNVGCFLFSNKRLSFLAEISPYGMNCCWTWVSLKNSSETPTMGKYYHLLSTILSLVRSAEQCSGVRKCVRLELNIFKHQTSEYIIIHSFIQYFQSSGRFLAGNQRTWRKLGHGVNMQRNST